MVGVRQSRFVTAVALVGAVVFVALAGCSSIAPPPAGPAAGGTTSAPTTPAAPATTRATPPPSRLPGETDGAFVFRLQCASCHGTKGDGNLGPSLIGIADRLSAEDQQAIVRGGKGRMPPFTPGLTDAEIAAVIDYTRTQLR